MPRSLRAGAAALAFLLVFLLPAPAAHARARRPSRKSPHAEVLATATVETLPERKRHKNGREFLEFDIRLLAADRAPQQERGADGDLVFAKDRPVHVVHDLTCGGSPLKLSVGERIEIQGEYVAPPNGKDLIHFTHPADGSCGRAGGHPDGYIRPVPLRKAE